MLESGEIVEPVGSFPCVVVWLIALEYVRLYQVQRG